jgi:dihydrofolate reductase
MDRTGLIGTGSGLPWQLPTDLKRFKRLTLGKPLIMGRRTFESLGRPLPGRLNIILTRSLSDVAPGCRLARSFSEALTIAEKQLGESGQNEAMVIGGSAVFQEAAPRCDKLYLTVVEGRFAGNTFFPLGDFSAPDWQLVSQEMCPVDAHNPYQHWFYILERRRPGQGSLAQAACSLPELLKG